MALKVDLLNFPYFFSPPHEGRDISFQERTMSHFSPNFKDIVDGYFNSSMDVVGLSSCHTATSGMDYRWEDYMKQLPLQRYLDNADPQTGAIRFKRASDNKEITLLHGQKVRAYFGKMPVYAHAIGVGKLIQPTRQLEPTLEDIQSQGGIAFIVDTLDESFFRKAVNLAHQGLADGVCISSYVPEDQARAIGKRLLSEEVDFIPVSGNHGYKNAGTSYIELITDKQFSIEGMKSALKNNNYRAVVGHTSKLTRALSRDVHIALSAPFHKAEGGVRWLEYKGLIKFRGKSSA